MTVINSKNEIPRMQAVSLKILLKYCIFKEISILYLSMDVLPVTPVGQTQVNWLRWSRQVAPRAHGELAHSFTSVSQLTPENPKIKKNEKYFT